MADGIDIECLVGSFFELPLLDYELQKRHIGVRVKYLTTRKFMRD